MLRALREREIANLLRNYSDRCAGRERAANYSPLCALGFAAQSSSTPASPSCRGSTRRTTRRWHEPCRSQKFAVLFADRMLRNLGTSIHCFGQLMRAIFLRSSLITTTESAQSLAPSRFDEPRGTVRYGVIPQRRAHHATGHMSCCEQHSSPHTIRARCYGIRNLHATVRATMLATQLNLLKVRADRK
jgi:hypothetical protein